MAPLDNMHFGCASASTFSSLEDVRYEGLGSLDLPSRPGLAAYNPQPTRLDHLSLLHRLPNEIVAYIYSFLGMRDLLNVTWVCRYWRDVALYQATLWSKDLLLFPSATVDLLARSSSTPLEVAVEMDWGSATNTQTYRNSVTALFRHVHRFRELAIIGPSDRNRQTLHTLGLNHAPALETFIVECLGGDILILDSSIFHGDMPRLRSVTANNVKIPFRSPLFSPTLRHLTLSFFGYSTEYKHFYSELLASLDCLKSLESFRLLLSSSVPSPILEHPVVALPHLQALCLHGGALQNRWFWDHIETPALAHLCMETTIDSDATLISQSGLVIPSVFHPEADPVSESLAHPLHTARIVVGHNQMTLTAWAELLHPIAAPPLINTREHHTTPLHLSFQVPGNASLSMDKVAATLIPRLQVANVRLLHLQTPIESRFPSMFVSTPLSSPGFAMMPSFTSLEHLVIQNDTVIRPFFEWLSQQMSSANIIAPGFAVPLPTLRHLVLVSGTFLPGSAMGSRQACKALSRYLVMRRTQDTRVEIVETVRCHLDSEWVESMKPLVSSLIVNGKHVTS